MTTQYNIVTYGDLINTNGVLSGFSGSNYATIPLNFNPVQRPFEVVFKFAGTNGVIWNVGDLTTPRGHIEFEVYQNKLYTEASANTTLIWSIDGVTTLSPNTNYWAKLAYNGVDRYSLYLSTDGTTWNTEGTVTSSAFLADGSTEYNLIGCQTENGAITYSFDGSIDLNESYISIDNIRWWQGVTSISNVRTRIQLRHDTAANWTSVNPILLVGEVGIETDTRKQKFGDGTTAWNSLSYSNGDMKQNVLTAGSNIQINGNTISATNTTYSAMTVNEGTTGTSTTARTMRADRLKSIIQGTKLTGLDTNYYTPITEVDNILGALGKLQVGVDNANSMYDYKADDFVLDSPLVESWDNLGIDFAEGVGTIDSASILSSNTNDGWCNGQLPEMQSTNLINDYWEWSGVFRSADISSEVEIIAIDGVNNGGFIFYIQPNGNITNPDDNNKVLANVYFNDWVRFTIIHQAGDTDITVTLDNAQGGTTTTTTALATTSPQLISTVSWRLNVSPKIDYIVGTDCYFRTTAGGTKYFFTKRHIGVDNEAIDSKANTSLNNLSATGKKVIDGQWVAVNTTLVNAVSLNGSSNLTYTLSLPDSTYKYEVLLDLQIETGSASGNRLNGTIATDIVTDVNLCSCRTRTASTMQSAGAAIVPVSTSHKVYLYRNTNYNGTATLRLKGYRRIGTNS